MSEPKPILYWTVRNIYGMFTAVAVTTDRREYTHLSGSHNDKQWRAPRVTCYGKFRTQDMANEAALKISRITLAKIRRIQDLEHSIRLEREKCDNQIQELIGSVAKEVIQNVNEANACNDW